MADGSIEKFVIEYDPVSPESDAADWVTPSTAAAAVEPLPQAVPWPAGIAPRANPRNPAPNEGDDLSAFAGYDALVVTWTSAEAAAMAALLTPGYPSTEWYEYRHNVADYIPLVTGRDAPFNDKSPDSARYYQSLGLYFPCTIGPLRILLFKSGLHLDVDGPATPVRRLMQELLDVVRPKMFITTGTGGAIVAPDTGEVALGDVIIASTTRFFCTTQFKDAAFANASYQTAALPVGATALMTPALLSVNAARIPNARPVPKLWYGPDATIVTTDFFAFDDSSNTYNLQHKGQVCDMGDAMVGDVLSASGIPWFAIRNASDPQIADPDGDIEAAKKSATSIYATYGALTTAGSVIATWGVIVSYFGH